MKVRRLLQITAIIGTLVVGVAVMTVIVSQTAWFKDWLRGFIVRQAEDYVNGRLSIGRLDGNLFFGVELEDVGVTMNGKKVVDIKDVGLDYNVFTFILGHLVLDDIRLNQPILRVERDADGWNITRLIKVRTPDTTRRRRPIEIGEIGISDGTLYIEDGAVGTSGVDIPAQIDQLDASLGVTSDEDALTIDINHVSLRSAEPRIGINSLSGTIRRTRDAVTFDDVSLRTEETSLRVGGTIHTVEGANRTVDIQASSDKFDVEEIARVIPALRGYALQPAFEVRASGPLDRMAVDLNARDARLGGVVGDLTVDWTAPGRRIAGTVALNHFNLAPLLAGRKGPPYTRTTAGPINSDIVGQARLDLTLTSAGQPLRGTYTINATRAVVAGYEGRNVTATGRIDGRVIRLNAKADAYGGRATATGTITTGQPLALNLTGRAARVDLRNLPPVFQAPGLPSDLQFSYTLTGSGGRYSGDARLDTSTIAGATIAPGTIAKFAFGAGTPSYAADGRVIDLDLQQIGRGFAIRMLAEDRFASRVNATFGIQGSGGGRYPLTLDASGTIAESELFGASVSRFDFTTHIGGGDAQVQATGRFVGLDPAVVFADDTLRGKLTGTVDANTTIRGYANGVTVDSLDVSGRADLERSTIGDLTIDTAIVQGTYANRAGEIAQLSMTGPDLNATAKGPIALNDTGESNLAAHLETPSLDRIGRLLGRPLEGAAIVDARVTGNGRELKAAGTAEGSNIAYGETKALSVNGTFELTLPDLTPEHASIQSNATATFVEIGGQSIRQLTADTTYSQSTLDFNAVAQEGMRQLAADGMAVFHPDHQEVHLRNLALKAEQVQWQTVPGSEASIQYGHDRIGIENLHLVSGDQRIDAEGVLGSNTETLRVRAANVDVAQLDRLALGDQRLAGRLTANAAVSGPVKDPRAEGEFTLSQGAFRAFKFDALEGKVDFAGRGMNIGVRLQQTPQAWLTATGYAPLSLFRRNPAGTEGHEVPGPGEGINLQIESTQIDLGVIQGFTSYVTNVTGALQANVKVTGTGHDPHLDGVIDIRGGTFAVPDLGTAYTGLDTRIDLKPDAVTIGEMRIVDKHKKVMTVGGTLGVHERQVGAVDVKLQSQDFEVINNEYADLKLDTDLRVTGELRSPTIEGVVEVDSGSVEAARILEEATANPYSTVDAGDSGEPAADTSDANILDALDVNVGVVVPSNLVVRGSNLRPANASIDIGDMSVTVGGLIQARKAPGATLMVTGEVNTIRGSYTFQGRRFEILRDGRIRFTGGEDIDPLIDLRARRIISGVETFVRVQGTMREPQLTFSSNPPLEQTDILSLIVFNAPINELGEGQQVSLAERAGALAGGYLAAGLTRSIANALELDEFELQAEGERNLAPTLSIGEQVGDRTYFRIRQGFGAEQATEFILEYQIADFLRLQGSVAETSAANQRVTFRRVERGGLDLIFFFSY